MLPKAILTTLTLAAVTAAGLSTAAFADRHDGQRGQGRMMPMFNFDALDSDGDGQITQAEIDAQRLDRVTGIDANTDGLLSAEELANAEIARMTARITVRATTRAARMVERFDADGDGLLSAAELAAGPSPVSLFGRLDTDGNGSISRAEAEAAQQRMSERGNRGPRHGQRGSERPRGDN